jgi:hypothetical protein
MTTEPSSAVSSPPITHHAPSLLACAVNSKFSLGTNELLAFLPLKPELTELENSCYQSVCASVPDEIVAAATTCPGSPASAGAGAITTAISTTVSSTVLSATTNPKQSSPTVPASTSAVAQSSTSVAPTTAFGTSSSAATNTVAGQASAASTSTAGGSSSGKRLGVSAGGVLAVFMGIVYGV